MTKTNSTLITIFTPSYNRAYTLPRLYESLCAQTDKDFEWLIVDDGSTDETEDVVKNFISEGKIIIRYYHKTNGGKHTAINFGVNEARGHLFFIVDSDDRLADFAIEWIKRTAAPIMLDKAFAGISGVCTYPNGHKVGGNDDFGTVDANAIDIRTKHFVTGDLAEVFKTDVLRHFPFPVFEGEKFCPEALVWNRIAQKHVLRYTDCGIYICEYLDDGLTAKIVKIRRNSPKSTMTCYAEQFHYDIPLRLKIRTAINFHRFSPKLFPRGYNMFNVLSILMIIPGKIMRLHDRKL